MSCRHAVPRARALRRATTVLAVTAGAAVAGIGFVPSSASAATSGSAIVAEAASLAGSPYVWGGTSPSGFDCSGFVDYVFAHEGISLPRTAQEQYDAVEHIPTADAEPGDIIFFYDSSGYVYHDGIYAGDGRMWDSAEPGTVVSERTIWTSSYWIGRASGVTTTAPTPVSYQPSPSSTLLQEGDMGSAVATLQGILHITADGDFGPQTLAAVMAFQRAHGLTVDGIVGPQTWAALKGGAAVPVSYHPTQSSHPLLEEGSTGSAVETVQRLVHVTVDGDFGPITRGAVMAFQSAHHLSVDGVVGPQTWGALLAGAV